MQPYRMPSRAPSVASQSTMPLTSVTDDDDEAYSLQPLSVSFRESDIEAEFRLFQVGASLHNYRVTNLLLFGGLVVWTALHPEGDRLLLTAGLAVLHLLQFGVSFVRRLLDVVFLRHYTVVGLLHLLPIHVFLLLLFRDTVASAQDADTMELQLQLFSVIYCALIPHISFVTQNTVALLLAVFVMIVIVPLHTLANPLSSSEQRNVETLLAAAVLTAFLLSHGRQRSLRITFGLVRRLQQDNIRISFKSNSRRSMVDTSERLFTRLIRRSKSSRRIAAEKGQFPWLVSPSNIEFVHLLGRGGYGEVWHGVWNDSNVAIKKLHGHGGSPETFISEISLCYNLRHPNIVLFMGACLEPNNFLLITELMDSSLSHILHDSHDYPLPIDLRYSLMAQASQGMSYLHSIDPPVHHRDLSTGNILVDSKWNAKISDFGLSRTAVPDKFSGSNTGEYTVGTLCYAAPEVIQMQTYSAKSDIYSFGMILYEVLSRQIPFRELVGRHVSPFAIVFHVCKKRVRPEIADETWTSIAKTPQTDRYVDLMRQCWEHEPELRPDFRSVKIALDTIVQQLFSDSQAAFSERLPVPTPANVAAVPPFDPTGAVVIDLPQIERLWDIDTALASASLRIVNRCIAIGVTRFNGAKVDGGPVRVVCVFPSPRLAIRFAVALQQDLVVAEWPTILHNFPGFRFLRGHEDRILFAGVVPSIGTASGAIARDKVLRSPAYHTAKEACAMAAHGEILVAETMAKALNGASPSAEPLTIEAFAEGVYRVSVPSLEERLGVKRWPRATIGQGVSGSSATEVETRDFMIPAEDLLPAEVIGQGDLGVVWLAEYRGSPVALKRLPRTSFSDDTMASFFEEIFDMRAVVHPNVVRVFGACVQPSEIALVLELAECTWNDYCNPELPLRVKIQGLRDGAKGLQFLHNLNLVHSNLRSSNVLVMSKDPLCVKLTDYGLNAIRFETATTRSLVNVTWLAPEVLDGDDFSPASDSYSFGVLIWESLTQPGTRFKDRPPYELALDVVSGLRAPPPDGVLEAIILVMRSCWAEHPKGRPDSAKLVAALDEIVLIV